ncbi:outer membrane protein assembly factor BamB [Woeseia oceani]|uniref:Outer membrane protein assembly factor BamB n=1 Tax=Woeseia oceani TaxID=1548547 RepID=A0A193LE61_9GAMM|nr:outer membrane protein assembly factor BamB [Woeseia oceani]ANO50815.1 outer membrane protein assembly factor BamB [Woeseia oceani]
MSKLGRISALFAVSVLLSACSLFGGGKDKELQPAELLEFDETLQVRKVWDAKVGGGSEALRLALQPAGDGSRIYAASYDGNITAFDPASGKRVWRVDSKLPLSAGPAVGSNLVIVGGSGGELICLSATDGTERWRIKLSGEVLATPVIKDDSVAVYTIDGTLRVLSTFDGAERWSLDQSLPPLTLRGSAAPVIVGTTVIAGFDNGRLVASNLLTGNGEWEAVLSPPSGRSDLERLADIDGNITAVGQDIYASGYNGRLASLAAESGQVLWAREISTYTGVSADWNNLYVAVDTGEIVALGRRNGSEVWRNDALLRREPTLPVPFDTAVVVGDFDGYVHFFSNLDGEPVARKRVGKGMVSGAPVVIGGTLYVQSESGVLAAFAVPDRDTKAVSGGTD